jgi:hypothetical protein
MNRKSHQSKPLKAFNLITKETICYTSVTEASKDLNIHHDLINKHMKLNSVYISFYGTRKFEAL